MQTVQSQVRVQPARDLALIAVFAGVTAALGLIPPLYLPISPVPITAQSLGPILAGAVLGGRRGGASQLLFLALVGLGLPLLAGGRGGLAPFVGPTWGFLVGWPIIAALIGWATSRFIGSPYVAWLGVAVNMVGGMLVLYAIGIPGMMLVAQLSLGQAILANAPYLVGDIIKCVIAALVAKGVHASVPGLLPDRSGR
ncbi:MAG: biotin transporter BioY [Brooklawnia sp.]|jgi:biotin transport system substrate-specific component